MSQFVDITIDIQDVFDSIERDKKAFFVNQNIEYADTQELICELRNRGYFAEEIHH